MRNYVNKLWEIFNRNIYASRITERDEFVSSTYVEPPRGGKFILYNDRITLYSNFRSGYYKQVSIEFETFTGPDIFGHWNV